jgi:hypothetical protein
MYINSFNIVYQKGGKKGERYVYGIEDGRSLFKRGMLTFEKRFKILLKTCNS